MSIYFECRDFNKCGWMGRDAGPHDARTCPECGGSVSKTMEAEELEHDYDPPEEECGEDHHRY